MNNDNYQNENEYESSNDFDTIPDEEFSQQTKPRKKQCSWPNSETSVGPNINLKFVKKRYSNDEEKQFFFEKIQKKKKTEVSASIMILITLFSCARTSNSIKIAITRLSAPLHMEAMSFAKTALRIAIRLRYAKAFRRSYVVLSARGAIIDMC